MTTSGTSTVSVTESKGSRTLRGAILVAGGLAIAQVTSYLLYLIGARLLGPAEFGSLAPLLNLILVGSVLALGLQAAGARRVVLTEQRHRRQVGAGVIRASLIAGIFVSIATAIVSPLISTLLHFSGPLPVILVAVNLYPATVFGGLLGVTQGREAHARLALICALSASGRAIGGIIGVVAGRSVLAALVGMTIGSFIAVIIGWLATQALIHRPAEKLAHFTPDVIHATHALFALFVLTNLDLLLAKHYLPDVEAGYYAAGVTVEKITFWLPQVVAMIAYPRLADHRRARTLGLGALAVILIGATATAVIALLPNLVVSFIGGSAYQPLAGDLWAFAAAGAVFGLAQFLLYGQLAASKRSAIIVLWAAVVSLVTLVAFFHSSILEIILIVLAIATAVSITGLVELLLERRNDRSEGAVAARAQAVAESHGD